MVYACIITTWFYIYLLQTTIYVNWVPFFVGQGNIVAGILTLAIANSLLVLGNLVFLVAILFKFLFYMLPGTCRASTGIGLPSIKKFLGELSQVESEKESALKSILQRLIVRFCKYHDKWRQLVSATAGLCTNFIHAE